MNIYKKIRSSSSLRRLAGILIAKYVNLVWATGKWKLIDVHYPEQSWRDNKPIIACFWHGRLLMLFKAWYGKHKLHMIISSHHDGEIIARTTQSFGYGWIAGSSTRGGKQAFLKTLKILKRGESVGITPDGPRGPRQRASLGVIQIARHSNAAIFPVTYSSSRGLFMKTWDRFFLPLPFGKGIILYGPLIDVANSSKNDEEIKEELENTLNALTQKADQLCHQTKETP